MSTDHDDDLERACSGNDSPEEPDYEDRVGYRRPPKHSRWKKGMRSPNPFGRPPKETSKKYLLETIANRHVAIKADGRAQQVTTLEAIITVARLRAIQGHQGASQLIDWLKGIVHDEELEEVPKAVFFAREKMPEEKWLEYVAPYRDKGAPLTAEESSEAERAWVNRRIRESAIVSCSGKKRSGTT